MLQTKRIIMEFHISRKSRDKYQFDESLYSLCGNIIFANFYAVRVFTQKMNDKCDLVKHPEQVIKAGQINAMGLIDEILHYMFRLFREQENTNVMQQALSWLETQFNKEDIDRALHRFTNEFPPVAVYRNDISVEEYIEGETENVPHRQLILEEMLMLWLANMNQAFSPYNELFSDLELDKATKYKQIISALFEFFKTQPKFGPDKQNLLEMLRMPAIEVPDSLQGQLDYIRKKWGSILGKYLYNLLSSLDFLKEEQKMGFLGPAQVEVYEYHGLEVESEKFSHDLDWMPRVVLLAKNAYVWLDQLSKKYQRDIYRLDHIPDKELDSLARQGFTVIWLIGLWERSKASKKIKQMCGNPEAEASAYSLLNYDIAYDLGGDEAFQDLKNRAWKRGIRMSGDMVPNHVGIDAEWVINHPDWFVSLDHSPYPSYSFNGQNLSWDDQVGIYLEDHYYNRTDAAVVFKRVDNLTGDVRYIYHGNDGTSMPWSDTAQLNYLKAEVREAVIQTILHVARNFPVIRFDAAMTLAKKHFKRLWFPDPGTGGDIPSRADHGLTADIFDELMPEEFWREVVDRVAEEAPDTLLMAEAFWLLEGYFVRTLGMHRVYNSAFMNMLKNEENAKYRSVIKNTIEFNPEILKRFVNFMSNPDEDTAIAQFGHDDKYFGVCAMMSTMPGLPMFGHGQIEGYEEKYGMEYRKAYWDEYPKEHLIQRHEKEIFPLLQKRHIFAEVENFLLYDFFAPDGHVNEDVYAYSNRYRDERALIVYHNKYSHARGWIKSSVAFAVKTDNDDELKLVQKNLGEGLALNSDGEHFCIFKDHNSGLEFIRNSKDICEQGLYIELGAFKYHIFLNFREIIDNEWHQYSQLTSYLDGRGVPSIDETLKEIFLAPIHTPFKQLVNAKMFKKLENSCITSVNQELDKELLSDINKELTLLLSEIKKLSLSNIKEETVANLINSKLEAILQLPILENIYTDGDSKKLSKALTFLNTIINEDKYFWSKILSWLFVHSLGKISDKKQSEQISRSWIDEWLFGKIIENELVDSGLESDFIWPTINTIKIFTTHQNWFDLKAPLNQKAYKVIEKMLKDSEVQQFLGVNRHKNILWYNKEAFDQLTNWMLLVAIINSTSNTQKLPSEIVKEIVKQYNIITKLKKAEQKSEYQIEKLLENVK